MTKAPRHQPEEKTHQQAPQPDPEPGVQMHSATGSGETGPSPEPYSGTPQGTSEPSRAPPWMKAAPTPLDAQSDTNTEAIIAAQLALLAAQFVEATYLSGQTQVDPPPATAPVPPAGAQLQAITDCLAGASRALGAYNSQLQTLLVLWPTLVPATSSPAVNGNGGTP